MRRLLALAVLLGGAGPLPAPPVFATSNYQLTFRIPPGLYSCPYPEEWEGTDHGVEFYLARPTACDPGQPIATEQARLVPRITVYYEHNVAETVRAGADTRTPATDGELMVRWCHARRQPAMLLGRRATGCLRRSGESIELEIGALYSQGGGLDDDVMLRLDTSVARYRRDLATLRAVAASLHVCGDSSRTGPIDRPAPGPRCPLHTRW